MHDKYLSLAIEGDATKAELCLISALNQAGIFNTCYARKSRVKKQIDLISKKERKITKEKKADYKIENITDVIGIRFVTLFRSEMPTVFEKVIDLIYHTNPLNPNPFEKGKIEEIIIYSANGSSFIEGEIVEISKKKHVEIVPEIKESKEGYSSVHIVSRLSSKCENVDSIISGYKIPIEIQIRTVFEDAWGEIDHKYGYSNRRIENEDSDGFNKSINDHLVILKKFSDACADYANQLHIQCINKYQTKITKENVLPVTSDEEIIHTFRDYGVDSVKITNYLQARDFRIEAENIVDSKRDAVLLEAASKFSDLVSYVDSDNISSDNTGEYIFYFYCKMNESICLLSTQDTSNISKSISIYLKLNKNYNEFPLLSMRIGQAYGKMGSSEISLKFFSETEKMIKKFEEENLVGDIRLPKTDYHHIKSHLPALHGYQIWKQASSIERKTSKDTSRIISLIVEAYNVTKQRKEWIEKGDERKLHNNLLYYAIDIVKNIDLVRRKSAALKGLKNYYISLISDHTKSLESYVDLKELSDLNTLDTLAKAYYFLNEIPKARFVLKKIIDIIVETKGSFNSSVSLASEIHEEAWKMLKAIDNQSD